MRLLLRDYVELLLMTGMRHGTEAMRVEWQHWDWYADKSGNKFLRLRVSGKTGARWLIAKHEAIGQMQLSASASTPHEIEHVMDRSLFDRYVAATTRRKFVELYRRHVRLLNIAPQEESGLVVHCRDARDNKFLALALACSADLIISSDTDFLSMNPYHGIPILKPAEFLNAYE